MGRCSRCYTVLLHDFRGVADQDTTASPKAREAVVSDCFHCGTRCAADALRREEKCFCCAGCLAVFELLKASGLEQFYRIDRSAGVRVRPEAAADRYRFLDDALVRERLVEFSNAKLTKVTFRVPTMHCLACVWLLENLFRLKPGLGKSQADFLKRQVTITFSTPEVRLSEVAALLASLGYEPELNLADLEHAPERPVHRKLWLQIGVAGFAFGNNMLLSIASYLGLDAASGPALHSLAGWISLVLALPVVLFSASDYWKLAWLGLRRRMLTIEVPIAAGILALFGQSVWEVATGRGEGYFDSLAGLLFFLLCGKLFQQKTWHRLSFDRDYKSFFPLSVTRRTSAGDESISIAQLRAGDRLLVRHGELVPADARLASGPGLIDYSFVTGESEPVETEPGDYLYAGGRQTGGTIEIETTEPPSHSYLARLWDQEAFRKPRPWHFDSMTNRYSERFTRLVLGIAIGAVMYWAVIDPSVAVKAFTSVLIVACPCALALAAPFALGTAIRILGRRDIFVKNGQAIEAMAEIDTLVFDKTGTLTRPEGADVVFEGRPLTAEEARWVHAVARHSTHPYSARIAEALAADGPALPERSFLETPGSGVEANVAGHEIWLGSARWLEQRQVPCPKQAGATGSLVHLAIDGAHRGSFVMANALRSGIERLLNDLGKRLRLVLLSGDHAREEALYRQLFPEGAPLHFEQTPRGKLTLIQSLQAWGRKVAMVGDGLNDAGALRQSEVGIAVVEKASAFSPASDVILPGAQVARLDALLNFSRRVAAVVRASFGLSAAYNIVGIGIAAAGLLSPVVCAILMPLSSISVVAFACAATEWAARRSGLTAGRKEAV